MSADRKSLRLWISTAALGCLGLLLWWFLRGEPEIEPAPPNPFVRDLSLRRLDDGQLIGETVEVPVNGGFYASAVYTAQETFPKTHEGKVVQDPAFWQTALVVYPRGSDRESEDALRSACLRFRRANERRKHPMNFGPLGAVPLGGFRDWASSGFDGPPEPPKSWPKTWPKEEYRLWTYCSARKDEPGEYVYELTLFPTAAWTSSVRFDIGTPVVLRRGLLRVVAEDE